MKLIAVITHPPEVRKILLHAGELAPRHRPSSRPAPSSSAVNGVVDRNRASYHSVPAYSVTIFRFELQ
jgi:hypothetical protein